jgi:hypothetical protein
MPAAVLLTAPICAGVVACGLSVRSWWFVKGATTATAADANAVTA